MRISYLATNYPFVPHTFIAGEIEALEEQGFEILPIALNKVRDGDLLTEADEREAARTFHLKATPPAVIIGTVLAAAVGHPIAFLKGLVRAVRAGGLDLGAAARHVLQFMEALLVWRHCERHEATAIHAHFGQAPATVAWFAAAFGNDVKRRRWTWSVTIHGWHEFADEDRSNLRRKFAAADLVVCISSYTLAQVKRLTAVQDWPKLAVIRCGVDTDAFALRPLPEAPAGPTVLCVARLAPEKGHLVLIEALELLRAEGLEVSTRFIGSGPFRPELEAAVARRGVGDLVEFVGAQSPAMVADALRAADVFCLPSFAEGLPVSIMEAMAVGVPVVTTYIGGIPELVVDGSTGWVVPAGNAPVLAGALRAALTSPARRAVVAAAHEAVATRHHQATNIGALADLFTACHGAGSEHRQPVAV